MAKCSNRLEKLCRYLFSRGLRNVTQILWNKTLRRKHWWLWGNHFWEALGRGSPVGRGPTRMCSSLQLQGETLPALSSWLDAKRSFVIPWGPSQHLRPQCLPSVLPAGFRFRSLETWSIHLVLAESRILECKIIWTKAGAMEISEYYKSSWSLEA